jgi:multiple sugar transport system ATP-binding protein
LTIYENIAFPLRTMKTPQAEVDRRVREMASLLGLRPLLTRKPRQLSGGQHQRVAIARALIKNPTLLLMDEPFSNVDAALRSQLRQLIKKIHETYHCTIVFVTHDLVEAFTLADRIMVLEDGKLQLLGQPQALIGDLERMGYSLPQPTGYSL